MTQPDRQQERLRKGLAKRAHRIGRHIDRDTPAVIVANDIAVFVRESSRVYGADLDHALDGILRTLPQR